MTGRRPLTHPTDMTRTPNPAVQFHRIHLPALSSFASGVRMAEFYSATVRLFDRFCGPVLLRDSHWWQCRGRLTSSNLPRLQARLCKRLRAEAWAKFHWPLRHQVGQTGYPAQISSHREAPRRAATPRSRSRLSLPTVLAASLRKPKRARKHPHLASNLRSVSALVMGRRRGARFSAPIFPPGRMRRPWLFPASTPQPALCRKTIRCRSPCALPGLQPQQATAPRAARRSTSKAA